MSAALQTAPIVTLKKNSQRRQWDILFIVLADVLAVELALLLACLFRLLASQLIPAAHSIGKDQYLGLCLGVLTVPLAYQCLGLYPGYGMGAIRRLRNRVYATFLVFAVLLGWNYAVENGKWSRGILGTTVIFALTIPPVFESKARRLFMRAGICGDSVVVIGSGPIAHAAISRLKNDPDLGLVPVLILDDDSRKWGTELEGVKISGPISSVANMTSTAGIALIALPDIARDALASLVKDLPFPRIMLILDFPGIQTLWTESRDLGGLLSLELQNNLLLSENRLLKTILDYLIAIPALLLTLPILAVSCIWICLISPGSPFFRHEREGGDGRPIRVWKLRTMHKNAEATLEAYLNANPAAKAAWNRHYKLKEDPRILPVIGKFLRKFSIDELPQLLNVVAGEMSLVGPRPLPHYHLSTFSNEFRTLRTKVRPGLTGMWQVSERSDADTVAQEYLDTYYIRNWSIWLDIYLLLRTVGTILFPRGAY